jgi:MoaA/NifB/PqqE/SkfB family radical SAM enzyme
MTITAEQPQDEATVPRMLWLDLTRRCQLSCSHCYNSSGPDGDHGTMTSEDWIRVLDEATDCGVQQIQLIGGEPTMHPAGAKLVEHALGLDLRVEIYTNLVHLPAPWWELFQRDGVSLATSYYSAQAAEHNADPGQHRAGRSACTSRSESRSSTPAETRPSRRPGAIWKRSG